MKNFIEVVRGQAVERPAQTAFTFLENGETEAETLTFASLDHEARSIAAQLQDRVNPGDRALLLYPPGLDFVKAFLGCLYAGVVAVPAYPPRKNRNRDRLVAVAADAAPAVTLTDEVVARSLSRAGDGHLDVSILVTGGTETAGSAAGRWREPVVGADDLAFLQYTSGSTGTPKGVMITHGNLLHNCELIKVAYSHTSESVFVSWLPVFHDMGLVGMVLQPIYTGSHAVLMEPAAFLQKPVRWLRAIGRYGGTTSGGPNSAYELCVRRISPTDREALDLSTWRLAYNGSEPVRASTVRSFSDTFASCGLARESVQPCYGMAETTLLVSSAGADRAPTFHSDAAGRTFVSSGRCWLDERVRIVDAETCEVLAEGQTGEIWVSSDSIAAGYWNRPELTVEAFGARIAGVSEGTGDQSHRGPFFRTGDLGFMRDDQLFVTGRLKDLVIIRGRNLYPQDIEHTAGSAHPALLSDSVAAFAVDTRTTEGDVAEQLVVVCEVVRERLHSLDATEVMAAVRRAVAEEHEVDPAAIILLRTLGLPKTSSGKVQRRACREQLLAGTLNVVGHWRRRSSSTATVAEGVRPRAATSYDDVRDWLVARIAAHAGVPPQQVSITDAFSRFGLDSQGAVVLSGELQDWLGRPVPATVAYDFPCVDALARHLGEVPASSESADHPTARRQAPESAETSEPVAIVGMACRFPGASTPEAFWDLLARGDDAVGVAPEDRPGAATLGVAGFIGGVDQFDAGAFGVTPREAEAMDPQQRLLLEVTSESIERAGLTPEQLAGSRTGVFVGISNLDYLRLQVGRPEASDVYAGTGNAFSIAANRLSYHFDLRGPSWAVDTACSSSLVAVHQACQSLRSGATDRAICGGVNLILSPELTDVFTRAGMMSPSKRCRTFDAAADGYVRGEGVGMVVLERLSDALRDGRTIHGIIRGSAVNQDGRSHGLTAPNGPAQQDVIRAALDDAGLEPGEIGYVEAHGTGTPLGDPIEVNALVDVLRHGRSMSQRCAIGSVKANIGHLESAAGIAGLIKTVLMMQHETVPQHLHFQRLNPHIGSDVSTGATMFVVPAQPLSWPRQDAARYAGVSSFGFGGTNAHVIVEEGPGPVPAAPATRRFDRQRYWCDERAPVVDSGGADQGLAPLLGQRRPSSGNTPDFPDTADTFVWESALTVDRLPFLSGHSVFGAVVLPYAAFVEMVLAAAAQLPGAPRRVTALRLHQPVAVSAAEGARLQTVIDLAPGDRWRVRVYNLTGASASTERVLAVSASIPR